MADRNHWSSWTDQAENLCSMPALPPHYEIHRAPALTSLPGPDDDWRQQAWEYLPKVLRDLFADPNAKTCGCQQACPPWPTQDNVS